jgi:aminopeptidase N
LATTQFEPISARQAFPCWDEPGIKAYFNIAIKHDEKYKPLSNTKIQNRSKEPKSSKYITKFEKTPIMSTYLVAFVISDYERYSNNETFNVWTRYNAINSTKYAYEIGELVLKELDEWTNIPYYSKIKKMDQITIPEMGGAMENWGLVTYR